MTVHNIALHLLIVFVFAAFLLILYLVCRRADSKIISRLSSRRSSQMSLASRKSSITNSSRRCAANSVSGENNHFAALEDVTEPAFS